MQDFTTDLSGHPYRQTFKTKTVEAMYSIFSQIRQPFVILSERQDKDFYYAYVSLTRPLRIRTK